MIAALLTVMLAFAQAQAPARDTSATSKAILGNSVISGVVTSPEGGSEMPLRRALVTIAGTGIIGGRQTVTDDAGRFVFDRLAAGRFTLTAEKMAYLKTYYGSRRPGRPPSIPIVLGESERIADVRITVMRGAVIDGTVRDENGRPVPSAQVMSLAVSVVDGARAVTPARGALEWAVTDDRGHYRLYGLMPGEYTVRATGGGAGGNAHQVMVAEIDAATRELKEPSVNAAAIVSPNLARRAVYLPGVPDAVSALTFTLGFGEERAGADIVTAMVASAAGVLTDIIMVGPDGVPLTNVSVGVADLTKQSMWFSPGLLRPGADGHVISQQLPPGTYQFFGRGAGAEVATAAPMPYWLRTDVVVDSRDMQQIVLRFAQGRTLTGKIRLPSGTAAADFSRVKIGLVPVLAIQGTAIQVSPAEVQVDGTFAFSQVPPGRYRLSVQAASGWTPLSASVGDRDVLDVPFEVTADADISDMSVTLTSAPTQISGLVTDALGRPSPEYSVVVFPADPQLRNNAPRRHSGLVKIATDGRFRVEGLPPGDYLLAVIVDADPQQLQDRAFLEQVAAGAIAIHLADGQKLVQDLKIGG